MIWRLKAGKTLTISEPLIAGIVNYTQDSFVMQSRSYSLDDVCSRIEEHIEHGADIIDIGAESTRPNAIPVEEDIEKAKLCALLHVMESRNISCIFSIDTYKASVARAVLEYRCDIINDVTGFYYEPHLVDVLCEYQPGYVLTFTTRYSENRQPTIDDVLRYFEAKMSFLVQKGLPEEHIVLDIGIGFGYTYPYSVEIMKNVHALHCFDRPLFLGISHKTWYQNSTSLSFEEKEQATMLSTALLASSIHVHRVHNVALAKRALYIARQLV